MIGLKSDHLGAAMQPPRASHDMNRRPTQLLVKIANILVSLDEHRVPANSSQRDECRRVSDNTVCQLRSLHHRLSR